MSLDAIVRLVYQGNNTDALGSVKGISAELQKQREAQKLAFYEEKARSAQARVGIAEQIADEKRRQNELKGTTNSVIALARAEENLRRAQAQARNNSNYLDLRKKELAAIGITGLDRISMNSFITQGGGIALRQAGGILGGLVPGRLGAIAQTANQVAGLALASEGAVSAIGGLGLALGAGGLVGAASLAMGAISQLSDQFGRASQAQTDAIFTTTEIVNAANVSRDRAKQLQTDFQRELVSRSGGLVDVGMSARIGRNFLDDALKGAQDQTKAVQTSARLASNLALLQGLRGGDMGQLQNVLTDVFSGSQTLDQLRGRDVLNDTGINKTLIPELQRMGVKTKLSEISTDKLLTAFDNAVGKIADQSRPELEKTIAGNLGRWNNKLFGQEGIFSITRVALNNRSLFDDLTQTSNLFFGQNGTLDQLATIFGAADFDLIRELQRSLIQFNSFLESVNSFFGAVANVQQGIAGFGFKGANIGGAELTIGGLTNFARDRFGDAIDIRPELGVLGREIEQSPLMRFINFLSGKGRSAFAGSLPGDMGGGSLMDAIATESRMKPPGSEMVVANSSELIFSTESQAMRWAAGRMNYQGGVTIQNLNLTQQPGENPRQLAHRMLEEFDLLLADRILRGA